ncbi:MAG TPA: DNA polymerase Y family protein [Candidatus Nitrosotalea sp.]|nr:DNA polymerase Y family protein [Candidatus Nitrosotalea sp.]
MGSICCGLIPHLELALHTPAPGRPLVVEMAEGRVLVASEAAQALGVEAGMTLRQAEARCPTLDSRPADHPASERLRQQLSAALYDLSPRIQVEADGRTWMDLEGLPDPAHSIRQARLRLSLVGTQPRLGLAPGPFTAALAAARARPGGMKKVVDAKLFLAPLPISQLGLEAELEERLQLLGLKTLGHLAGIGPRRLESQLGPSARLVVALARGEEPIPIDPWQPPTRSGARRLFEPPLEDREALLFVARGMASELARELGRRGVGAKRIRVRLQSDGSEDEIRESLLPRPLQGGAELFGLLSLWITGWVLKGPVSQLEIELPELEAAGRRQLRLWRVGEGGEEEVEAALDRLGERYGAGTVALLRPLLPLSPIPGRRFMLRPR